MPLKSDAKGLPYFGAISRVNEAYVYQMLVDLYGNVPYSQALKEPVYSSFV